MSTTVKLEVAVQYSTAQTSLLFKLRTDSFMQRGASIQFLSAFPAEEEGASIACPLHPYSLRSTSHARVLRNGFAFLRCSALPAADFPEANGQDNEHPLQGPHVQRDRGHAAVWWLRQ